MGVVEVLQFERDWETRSGSKTAAILERFGYSPARYYQRLYVLLDDPATVQLDPSLVRRLIRLRNARTAQRASFRWQRATELGA